MLRPGQRPFLQALENSGFFRLVLHSRWRARRLVVVCYHGISIDDEHEWNNQLYISQPALRRRFDLLRRGRYSVLPLREAFERLRAGTLPARSVALTFDDGAYDFYERAMPLLREFGYAATVYQTTHYSEFQRPVFDTGCAYVLWKSGRAIADLGDVVPHADGLSLKTDENRRAAALRIREYANRAELSSDAKDDLLRRIAARLGVDYEKAFAGRVLFLMTPDEIRRVAAEGIDVQMHTHRHRTPADPAAFRKEIDDNRASLERTLGPGRRDHFCYPSGVYRPEFLGWLAEAGVRSATTCEFGVASRTTNPLVLPRLVDTANISRVEFEAWLTGAAEWLRWPAAAWRRISRRFRSQPALEHQRGKAVTLPESIEVR